MGAFQELEIYWDNVQRDFLSSKPMVRLFSRDITVDHYASYLRESYFYTREDPQKQAAAVAYFRGEDRKMVKYFLRHALSEVGHDQLALNDLVELGFNVDRTPEENPLPATLAMTAFAYYSIQYRRPVSYLGWLYFLEFLPTRQGDQLSAALRQIGVPASAMSFLDEHRTADAQHNKLVRMYADHMIRSEEDLAEVAYAMRVTGKLFANMLESAFESADQGRIGNGHSACVAAE